MGEGSMVRASAVVKATGSLRGGHPPQSHALALGLKSPSLSPSRNDSVLLWADLEQTWRLIRTSGVQNELQGCWYHTPNGEQL
jgi:hypothetical protein